MGGEEEAWGRVIWQGGSMIMYQKSDERKHDMKIIQNPNDIAFV